MLGYTNEIKTNKDIYILKNTITNNDETTFVSPDIRAHVENPNYTLIDYIIIYPNARYESSMPPKLARLKEIFIYSDIIDTVLVGNTQASMLGYFPIQTKWGDQSYWNFNPPYYVKVYQKLIRSISIRLCNEQGETIEFESLTVICRLNFRRVCIMRGYM